VSINAKIGGARTVAAHPHAKTGVRPRFPKNRGQTTVSCAILPVAGRLQDFDSAALGNIGADDCLCELIG
jgi:hypothetical protein